MDVGDLCRHHRNHKRGRKQASKQASRSIINLITLPPSEGELHHLGGTANLGYGNTVRNSMFMLYTPLFRSQSNLRQPPLCIPLDSLTSILHTKFPRNSKSTKVKNLKIVRWAQIACRNSAEKHHKRLSRSASNRNTNTSGIHFEGLAWKSAWPTRIACKAVSRAKLEHWVMIFFGLCRKSVQSSMITAILVRRLHRIRLKGDKTYGSVFWSLFFTLLWNL